jgi:ribonuclease G
VTEVLKDHHPFTFEESDDEDVSLDESTGRVPLSRKRRRTERRIESLLKQGQEVLVQVAKDPIGTKGARLTCHISMPGRFLVFMPTVNHIGISRRVSSDSERRRLRGLIDEMRPEGSGFIVRTAAAKQPSEYIKQEMKQLIEDWQNTLISRDNNPAPCLLHSDLDLVLRCTRDLLNKNVSRIVVDSPQYYKKIPDYIRRFMPEIHCRLEYHKENDPLFSCFGIEKELSRALDRKVWLPSGGSLYIDQTEALTAIDVNSGKYVGKKSLEDTITTVNLEAINEIVYQLRLRSIGGLIVIDFIDMDDHKNRDLVYRTLSKALEKDKARPNILKISEFGLVEMTRKRVRENVVQQLCEPCRHCDNSGWVQSQETVVYHLLRDLTQQLPSNKKTAVSVRAEKNVIGFLKKNEQDSLDALSEKFQCKIQLRSSSSLDRADYRIEFKRSSNSENRGSRGTRGPTKGGDSPKQGNNQRKDAGEQKNNRNVTPNRAGERPKEQRRDPNRSPQQ